MAAPEVVLSDLRDTWRSALEARLVGLYVYGSLTAGDFAADRSDLDVLAVLDADPDEDLLEMLADLHEGLETRHPSWAGRIEVEYVSVEAVRDAARGRTAPGHRIARISPGESLHLLPVTTHRAVTWSTVHDSGRRLLGPPAGVVLPPFDPAIVRSALLDHVRDWPAWVLGMTTPGAQSYAVLTMCRALQRLRYGRQLSKRQAADRTIGVLPEWAGLVGWARDWWYGHGEETDTGRFDDVRRFVGEISAVLLAADHDLSRRRAGGPR